MLGQLSSFQTGCAPWSKRNVPLHVEIDVYSGRPNPSFDLTTREVAELAKLLQNLPATGAGAPELHLGYRGFVITSEASIAPGLPSQVRIYAGRVIPEEGPKPRVYDDINSVEEWLKERARRAGYGALLN
jgi:hypothetical protein